MPRVLVVEDNPVNAFVALKQLRPLGCVGSAVSSGRDAIEAVKREAFDLILMDCRMPEMDGYQTARSIRACEKLADHGRVPIVAVTLDNENGTLEKCISAGMDGHLPKPASMNGLRNALERFVG